MRRSDREIQDINIIQGLLECCHVCHIGMVDQGTPYVVPMNYGFLLEGQTLTFYLHSARQGRKVELFKENPKVCVEIEKAERMIGEGDIACRYGYLYESLIGVGTVREVTDEKEKQFGLARLMKQVTRTDNYRYDGLDTVNVYKIMIDEYSVKAHHGS